MSKNITLFELRTHNTFDNCWIAISGFVYNVTSFLAKHPGGSQIILQVAGTDATNEFMSVHSKDTITLLPKSACVGMLENYHVENYVENKRNTTNRPDIKDMVTVFDVEEVASKVMDKKGWNYYCSGGEDEITLRENIMVYRRIWFKPRVCIDVSKVDTSSVVLGRTIAMPIYISAHALAKLADPKGEIAYMHAAAKYNIPFMVPTMSSCSVEEIFAAATKQQPFYFQLYVSKDRRKAKALISLAEKIGCQALFITVDAPQMGKRDRDIRTKRAMAPLGDSNTIHTGDSGVANILSHMIDPALNWNDCIELKKCTTLNTYLKGIQVAEDALLAYEYGFNGIVISNHGGRQLDTCRSGIEILVEVIDGGVRRGADIFKAIALGAKAVGIGRAFIYGLAAYGQDGVELVMRMLRDEFEIVMKLNGCQTLADIHPNMITTNLLYNRYIPSPDDLTSRTFSKL